MDHPFVPDNRTVALPDAPDNSNSNGGTDEYLTASPNLSTPGSPEQRWLTESAGRVRQLLRLEALVWQVVAAELTAARERCRGVRGRWGRYLADCGIKERTARDYTRAAKLVAEGTVEQGLNLHETLGRGRTKTVESAVLETSRTVHAAGCSLSRLGISGEILQQDLAELVEQRGDDPRVRELVAEVERIVRETNEVARDFAASRARWVRTIHRMDPELPKVAGFLESS